MSELYSIPLTCKEGVYSVFDFYQDADGEDAIFFDYDTQYQMLTYDIREVLSSVFVKLFSIRI